MNPFKSRYTLNVKNSKQTILINHEAPIITITSAIIKTKNDTNYNDVKTQVILSYTLKSSNDQYKQTDNLYESGQLICMSEEFLDITKELREIPYDSKYSILELNFNCTQYNEIILDIEQKAIQISIEPLFTGFKNHLDLANNSRILFSAPFGKGKTTFLNLYFDEYYNEYEVFHLYPVNYSVASNEDIFKYIKAELLLQLLIRCDDFQHFEFNNYETLAYYFNNLKQDEFLDSFTPFIKCIPLVGETTYKFVEQLIKLYKSVIKVKVETTIDEKKAALDYIKTLSIKEGSIYEDDLYTQLIRSLIKHISKTTNKKTVFVIDDLDRLDPDHIFRILNILSAHFDNQFYTTGGDHNKFGFDKIIITCDYHNIYNIYSHKYGEKTDFKGYINKYYSIEPYKFENEKLLKTELDKLFGNLDAVFMMRILKELLYLHIENNLFNTRDLINLKKQNIISDYYYTRYISKAKNKKFAFFILIHFLVKIYNNKETVKNNLAVCSYLHDDSSKFNIASFINFAKKFGLAYKYSNGNHAANKYYYKSKHLEYEFYISLATIESEHFQFLTINGVENADKHANSNKIYSLQFGLEDFFELFVINIDEYYKHGELNGKNYE